MEQRVEKTGKDRNWPDRGGFIYDGGRCLELGAWFLTAVLLAVACVFPVYNPEALSIFLMSTIIVMGTIFFFAFAFGFYGGSMHRTYADNMHRVVKFGWSGWTLGVFAAPIHIYCITYGAFALWCLPIVATGAIFVNFVVEGLVLLVIGLPILLITSGGRETMKEVWAMKMEDMRERKAVGGTLRQTREYIGWTNVWISSICFWKNLFCGKARLYILALAVNLIAEYWMSMCAHMWQSVRVISSSALNALDPNRLAREMVVSMLQQRRITLWDFEAFQPQWDFPELKERPPVMWKFMEPQKVQPPTGPEWKIDMNLPEIMPRFPPNVEALKDAPEIELMPGFDEDEFMPRKMEPGYTTVDNSYHEPWPELPENAYDDWIPFSVPFHLLLMDYGSLMVPMIMECLCDIFMMPLFFGKAALLAERVERARQFGRATVMKARDNSVRSSGVDEQKMQTESVGDVIH